jgi:serine/threonine-protein kinase
VCAYQFLAGRLPHEYNSLTELALKQQQAHVEPITVHRPEVPPELDRAIRVCLERDPVARYPSTLEMARGLEAGLEGMETEATRRLSGIAAAPMHEDATRALGQVTAATNAMRTRRTGAHAPSQAQRLRQPTPPPPRQAAPARDRRRGRGRRRLGGFLTAIALLAAAVAVTLALLASGGGGDPIAPVSRDNVDQQLDDLRQFLRDNTR